MSASESPINRLKERAKQGMRGYPVATLAFYGPDDQRASKVVVGVIDENEALVALERWYSPSLDARFNPGLARKILKFIDQNQAVSVVMSENILGCPHEEGIDYPEGENCPHCPFWANRDRWTGRLFPESSTGPGELGIPQQREPAHTVVGVAWYRAEQWERLREVADDPERLEMPYEEWQQGAEEALQRLTKEGLDPIPVPVDVEALIQWCREHNRPIDGNTRAEYAAHRLAQMSMEEE
jgi:hypothetical protein